MNARRAGPPLRLAWLLAQGCGAANGAVPDYPQPAFAPALSVPGEPPPAQIEYFPSEPPAPGCLWVDGQWVWASQHWDWRPGGWIRPAEGCRYSLPSASWGLAGNLPTLYYRPGRWYSETEPKACPDPPPCTGSSAGDPPLRPTR